MTTPRRYSSGISNVTSSTTLGDLGTPDPTKYHVFFDDFNQFDPTDALDWDVATTGSVAMADGDGGRIILTTGTSDNDVTTIATMTEIVTLEAGKKSWFKTKISAVSHATSLDVIIGLHVDDQTPVAGAPADGIYFRKDDGDTSWDIQVIASSVSVAVDTAIATCTTGAITLGWAFDGVSNFDIYVDDAKVGNIATADFPTTELGASITVQAGTSSAATLTVDYIFAAKER
jgi:hypothetical protein